MSKFDHINRIVLLLSFLIAMCLCLTQGAVAETPSPSLVPSPVYANSISSDTLWQYLNNWDFAGFILACWTMNLGQSFFVVVAIIVSVAIYVRYQNVIAIGIMWIVLGGVFIAWVPIVVPFIIFAFVMGFGSILYKVLGESKP